MKKAPEEIARGMLLRPWKTMKMAVWVVDGKRHNRKVMHGMAPVKQGINGPE